MAITKNGVAVNKIAIHKNGLEAYEVSKNGVKAYDKGMPSHPDYFYVEAIEGNATINFTGSSGLMIAPTLEYSLNSYNNFVPYTIGHNITINEGQRCCFRGDNELFNQDYNAFVSLKASNPIKVGGNIMTLLDSTGELKDLTGKDFTFAYLFEYLTTLQSINNLKLPATKLAPHSYHSMFSNTHIKVSAVQTGNYKIPFRIPSEGEGIDDTDSLTNMFKDTIGTFGGTPNINTTYYLWED